jgi:hypothetical protein
VDAAAARAQLAEVRRRYAVLRERSQTLGLVGSEGHRPFAAQPHVAVGAAAVLRTGVETTQSSRAALADWAAGLAVAHLGMPVAAAAPAGRLYSPAQRSMVRELPPEVLRVHLEPRLDELPVRHAEDVDPGDLEPTARRGCP